MFFRFPSAQGLFGSTWKIRIRSLCLIPLLAAAAPLYAQESPREIIDHVDRLLRGTSSHGRMTMEIRTAHWQRSLSMEEWSLGTDYALVRVIAPLKEAGTATLMTKQEVWNYLPRVDRTIKIPASLMMGAWMGSHFTNDDLVKESRLINDYDIALAFNGERDGVRVWELQLTPKPEAPVVWGKIIYQVRQSDLLPIWARYYDEEARLVRTVTFTTPKRFGDRTVPSVITALPADKPDERTVIRYDDLDFGIALTPSFFSLRNLRRR